MQVVAAPERRELGQALAAALGGGIVPFERQVFPDGERCLRIRPRLDGPTVVLSDTRPNDLFVDALLACDAAREAGASAVTLCVPYLAYARQDRSFNPYEAVSSRAVLGALRRVADALVTVDVHKESVLAFFGGPVTSETAGPEVAGQLRLEGVTQVLAPDRGARDRAEGVASALGCPADHLEKTRLSATDVRMAPKRLDVRGGTVAIVDDIVSTGGTMAMATRQLISAGASRVIVAATHGLFVAGAEKRLEEAGVSRILVTDAVPTAYSVISSAPALARGVRRLQAR